MNPPRDQHGEHPITPCDSLLDNLAVIRSAGNDCDAPFELREFADTLLPTDANHLVASIEGMPHHVPTEFPRSPDNANFHRSLSPFIV